jgi:hypothetical protein
MVSRFKNGDIVFERIRPSQELIIRKCVGVLYYCEMQDHPKRKELVFFEKELISKDKLY